MPIHLDCPVCSQRLRVPNFAAGRITKCTSCGNAVRVPQPKAMLGKDEDQDEKAAEDATATSKSKEPQPFSLSELWYRSFERLSGSLDWLADRPIRIVFVALILVGCYVGVAAAKWALSKPAALPLIPDEPDDPEPWEGVGLTAANDQVRVTAQSVTTEQINVIAPGSSATVKTPKAYLRIALKIENLGHSELKYLGWSTSAGNEGRPATLKDNIGVVDKQVVWKARIVGQTPTAVIPPSGSIVDLLVFEHPGTDATHLKLTLPSEACGGTGSLRIKIPRVRFRD